MLTIKKVHKIYLLILLILSTSCIEDKSSKIDNAVQVNDTLYIEKYDSGKTAIIASLKDGEFEGLYKSFYENGNIKSEGISVKDEKEGIWKYYDSDGELDRVENYEGGEVLFNLNVNDFTLKKVELAPTDYTIKVPYKWKTNEIDNPLGLLNTEQVCANKSKICPNVTITYEPLKEGISYSEYIKQAIISLEKMMPDFKKVDSKKYSVNGRETFRVQYLSIINDIARGNAIHFINDNDNVVMIFTSAENSKNNKDYLKYRLLFKEIVDSFR